MAVRDRLARFCSELKFEDIPSGIVDITKIFIIDQVGLTIAGARMLPDRNHIDIAGLFREMGGKEESSLIGERCKVPCINAAFSNTAVSFYGGHGARHIASSTHVANSLLPAVIAVAEREQAGGKDFILAAVAGIEIMVRVGMALVDSSLKFDTTSLCAPLGCAVAAGKLLGLEQDMLAEAISIAAVQGSGLFLHPIQPRVPDVERFQYAAAAQGGVMAAFMAQMGGAGIADIFEDPRGFLTAFSPNPDQAKLTDGLGTVYEVKNVTMKRFSIAGTITAVVETLLDIMQKNRLRAEDVDRIICKVPSYLVPEIGSPGYPVTSGVIPEMSARYLLAVAAYKREEMMYSVEHITEDCLNDPRHIELFERVDILGEPKLDELGHGLRPCILTVKTKDGKEFTQFDDKPAKGDPENPLTLQDVETKFTRFVSPVLGSQKCDRVLDILCNLENTDDISGLMHILGDK